MDGLIELFCDVDDFCQAFLPVWQKQLLSASEVQRQRERSLTVSVTLSPLQGLLYRICLGALASRISWSGQLQPLCRVHSFDLGSSVRLPAHALSGNLHRPSLY